MNLSATNALLILEWNSSCQQFLITHQSQHGWSQEKCLYKMWKSVVLTKYLNSTLIENFIEILPKLSSESKSSVCSEISKNPALTMNMISTYPEL